MRVSVNRNDEGYISDPGNYKVFLDGKELESCVMADEEKGEAEVYKKDKNGDYFVEGYAVIATEIVYGEIEIRKTK